MFLFLKNTLYVHRSNWCRRTPCMKITVDEMAIVCIPQNISFKSSFQVVAKSWKKPHAWQCGLSSKWCFFYEGFNLERNGVRCSKPKCCAESTQVSPTLSTGEEGGSQGVCETGGSPVKPLIGGSQAVHTQKSIYWQWELPPSHTDGPWA